RPEMLGEPRGHAPQLVVQALGVADVLRKRLLLRDRDALRYIETVGWPGVGPAGTLVQHAADLPAQEWVVLAERGEVADRLDAHPTQPLVGARADARQHTQRQRREEGSLAARTHHRQATGLAAVGSDLGHD